MLSSETTCYHLGRHVIIWDAMLSSGANVIIWVKILSSGANVIMVSSGAIVIIWCNHVMLSSGMITHPDFIFPENFTHSLDLQSLFWLLCTGGHWPRPRNSLLPPHLGSYTRALLVSQDRHLFGTPCLVPRTSGGISWQEWVTYILWNVSVLFICTFKTQFWSYCTFVNRAVLRIQNDFFRIQIRIFKSFRIRIFIFLHLVYFTVFLAEKKKGITFLTLYLFCMN
jgi:hypothetical protein